jgi:acyl carrier protein
MSDVVQPPRTRHEEGIAAIWSEVLGRPAVGVLDDFFDLDGTSLQAIQVVARIRQAWGVDIRARDFFESPTVATLAAAVAAKSPSGRPAIGPRPPDSEPVLSYDQQRLWLEHQVRPGTAYNVHERRRLVGRLDVAALENSIRAIVARHESLRSRFTTVDGKPVQVVDPPGANPVLDFADVAGGGGDIAETARRLADEQATTIFDMAAGPLLRCLLIKVAEDEHLLSVTAHHIVCDNWSIGLFAREFAALYAAGGDVERAGLPALPIQYRDYAVWQRRWLAGDALAEQVEYWRKHLAGAPATLALPTTGRHSAVGEQRGGRTCSALSKEEAVALGEVCRTYGVTTFMAILASLATVLGRWSGQADVVIGVPITGRTEPGTEQLIGYFGNTLPVRVDMSGDPTFADLVRRVRKAALGGYAHADAPFDLLIQELRIARDPRRTPLCQVFLNAIETPVMDQITGLSAEPAEVPAQPCKVDLALSIREADGIAHLELDYNADRHQAAMVRLLLEQVGALLRAGAEDPSRGIRDYPLHASHT